MIRQISISIRRYLRWIPFFLVLLFLFVQLMPRALGQRQLGNKSSDAEVPSATQASISSSPLGEPPGACSGYVIGQIAGNIVPGTLDIGNHCADCGTLINLPFTYTLYNQLFTTVRVSANGRLDFVTDHVINNVNNCLPAPPDPNGPFDYTISAYWDDLRTDIGASGIFTSVSGVFPNRFFNIEFRTVYFNNNAQNADFEVRLYEGQARFDVIYGPVQKGNTSATAGVQKSDSNFRKST